MPYNVMTPSANSQAILDTSNMKTNNPFKYFNLLKADFLSVKPLDFPASIQNQPDIRRFLAAQPQRNLSLPAQIVGNELRGTFLEKFLRRS